MTNIHKFSIIPTLVFAILATVCMLWIYSIPGKIRHSQRTEIIESIPQHQSTQKWQSVTRKGSWPDVPDVYLVSFSYSENPEEIFTFYLEYFKNQGWTLIENNRNSDPRQYIKWEKKVMGKKYLLEINYYPRISVDSSQFTNFSINLY